jgi:RNA-directed DNA polymerase
MREKIGDILDYRNTYKPIKEVAGELNRLLLGWGNYYSLGYRKKVYSAVNYHVGYKFWKFCTRKSQRKMKLPDAIQSWHVFARGNGVNFLTYGSILQ